MEPPDNSLGRAQSVFTDSYHLVSYLSLFFFLSLFLLFSVRTESVQPRLTLDSWHFLLVKFISYLFLVPYPSSFPFSNSLCPFPLLLFCSSVIGLRITHILAMHVTTEPRKDPDPISLCVSEKGTCLACVWGGGEVNDRRTWDKQEEGSMNYGL